MASSTCRMLTRGHLVSVLAEATSHLYCSCVAALVPLVCPDIIARFERKGYKLVGIKVVVPTAVRGQHQTNCSPMQPGPSSLMLSAICVD
jgi:hypothetical protein